VQVGVAKLSYAFGAGKIAKRMAAEVDQPRALGQ